MQGTSGPLSCVLRWGHHSCTCERAGPVAGGSFKDDLEVCGTMDQRYLQADLIKRASVAASWPEAIQQFYAVLVFLVDFCIVNRDAGKH